MVALVSTTVTYKTVSLSAERVLYHLFMTERVEADSGSKLEIQIPGAGKQARTRVYVREY
jgi:hypothetical protein